MRIFLLLFFISCLSACSTDFNEQAIDKLFFQYNLDCDPAAIDTLYPEQASGLSSICVERPEVWKDLFDNNDLNWPTALNTATIQAGQYQIDATTWNALVDLDPGYMQADFELEMWLQIPTNNGPERGIMLFGANGTDKAAYALMMKPGGTVGLYKTDDYTKGSATYEPLLPDQSGLFHYDPGLVSQLLVRRWKGQYYFFFNDAYLGTVPNPVWNGNSIGIRVERGMVNVERVNYWEFRY